MDFLKKDIAFFVLDSDVKKVRKNKKYALCGCYIKLGKEIKIKNIATGDIYDLEYDNETEREFVQIGDMKLSKVKLVKDKAHYCFDADQKSYAKNIAKLRSFNLQEYYSSYVFVSKKQLLLVLDEINNAIHKKQVTNEMIKDLKNLFE